MTENKITSCDPVTLKPVVGIVPDIPRIPEYPETDQAFTIDDSNDPVNFRCTLAGNFNNDLTQGKWKHFLSYHSFDESHFRYSELAQRSGWDRMNGFKNDHVIATWLERKRAARTYTLLIFTFPTAEGSRILAGFTRIL